MTIGIAGALLGLGTYSFLYDIETSEDNYFTAGEIDLQIDCDSYYFRDWPEPKLMDEIHFDLTDLTIEKFFEWDDLKPGDHGEATISFHVFDNDAWGWIHFFDVYDYENGLTEPEMEVDATGGAEEGELSKNIYTFMWLDEGRIPGWQGPEADEWEGNNEFDVWECDIGVTCNEPIIIGTPYQEDVTMYDMHELDCCWTGPWYIEGCNTVYIGWYWWIPHDVGNIIQSDSFEFGVEFFVEQYRNNPNPEPPGIPCDEPPPEDADISILKEADNDKPEINDPVVYTITVENHGPADATDVTVSDLLPADLLYVTHSADKGTYDHNTGIWNIGNLAYGEVVQLTITAEVIGTGGGGDIEFTQLAMVLDGSGSIESGDWIIMKDGLAYAIRNCIPDTDKVELTVIQFSGLCAQVELPPTVITAGNKNDIATIIENMDQGGSFTPMAAGLSLAADQLYNSVNHSPDDKQVINIVTDGAPNVTSDPGEYCGNYDLSQGKPTAVAARNYLIDLLKMTSDQDEFDAEAVGGGAEAEWLRSDIVWPETNPAGGGNYAPPFNPGWVWELTDYEEFANSICQKFQVLFGNIKNCAEIIDSSPTDPNSGNDVSCYTIYPQPGE